MTTSTISRDTSVRAPLFIQIAAWAIPVLLLSGFAMIALLPVLVALIGSFTDQRARYLRWWTTAVAALYSIPLVILNVRPDPAGSLTKDMHPVFLVLIVVSAAALLARLYIGRRK
ncbi:hypothetical protein EYE40_11235 [Glaciihabitans arcticus]|uniref:Uncharacterized protein n=1 Tax=Glaciihabitans arcticus TaxID=2668039 RepID=A0A4Q9GYQ2_9MICO|nr:hypothetical protein [Glaciihabitans arcticus]TBN57923.1 hypothetical protein EYE40_11235 [Glaciihabitans arcticus]